MSDLVNQREICCDWCHDLIARGTLSVMDLSRYGGIVVQLVSPQKHEYNYGVGSGSTQTIASAGEAIACSKACAEKLMQKLANKRAGEDGLYIALSGQEIRKLGESLDAKAYLAEAWEPTRKELASWAGKIGVPGMRLGTTFDRIEKGIALAPTLKNDRILEAPAITVSREQQTAPVGNKVSTEENPKKTISWLKKRP